MTTLEEVRSPAEIYDAHFVPALFAQWGPVVAAEAEVREGRPGARRGLRHRRADACRCRNRRPFGIGRRAGRKSGNAGCCPPQVREDRMDGRNGRGAAVAGQQLRRRRQPVRLHVLRGQADGARRNDAGVKTGGRLAVAVCDAVENSPGYGAFALLLDRLFGKEVGDAFRAPFSLGDAGRLHEICNEAGIAGAEVNHRHGKVRFKSIDALVSTERACVWTLGGVLTDEQFERLLKESKKTLRPFVNNRARSNSTCPRSS